MEEDLEAELVVDLAEVEVVLMEAEVIAEEAAVMDLEEDLEEVVVQEDVGAVAEAKVVPMPQLAHQHRLQLIVEASKFIIQGTFSLNVIIILK